MFRWFGAVRRQVASITTSVPSKADSASASVPVTRVPAKATIKLNFWPPHPKTLFGFLNKSLSGRLSGGHTGHISMQAKLSDGKEEYVSVWPGRHSDTVLGSPHVFEPIVLAENLEIDIKSEAGITPESKLIEISDAQEKMLISAINKLKEEVEKHPELREQWGLTNNCATYVGKMLYEIGVIQQKPGYLMTPRYVFYIVDTLEQEQHLKDANTPSWMP